MAAIASFFRLWARSWNLTRADAWAGALCLLLLAARLATLDLSGFVAYHGGNEGNYASTAMGYNEHPLVPMRWGELVYNTPPLTSYVLWISTSLLGLNIWAVRVPSLLAGATAAVGLYFAARRIYGAATARAAAVLFLAMPWTLIWFGRAQTDPFYVALTLLAFALILHHRARRWCLPLGFIALGLAGAAKQPAVLLLAVLGLLLATSPAPRPEKVRLAWRGAFWLVVGSIPLVLYYAIQWALHPDEVLAAYLFEGGSRTPLFANVLRNIAGGLVLGASPLVLALAALGLPATRTWLRHPFVAWSLIFGAFVFARTPDWHDYYTLVLMPPAAVFAAVGTRRAAERLGTRLAHGRDVVGPALVLVVLSAIVTAVPVMAETGDLGDRSSQRTVAALEAYVAMHPDERTVVVIDRGLALTLFVWMPGLSEPGQFQTPFDVRHLSSGRQYDDRVPVEDIVNQTQDFDAALLVLGGPGGLLLHPELEVIERIDYEFILTTRSIWIQRLH